MTMSLGNYHLQELKKLPLVGEVRVSERKRAKHGFEKSGLIMTLIWKHKQRSTIRGTEYSHHFPQKQSTKRQNIVSPWKI